jgi:non-lysosomal glucosylceramidase
MAPVSRRNFIFKAPAAAATLACAGSLVAENSATNETDPEASNNVGSRTASSEPADHNLFSMAIRDTYEGDKLDQLAMPMGGIGTGCISFAGTGRLIDWEIFNNPNRGYQPFCSFLSVFAQEEGGKPAFRVLEGQLRAGFDGPLYLTRDMWQDGNGCGPQTSQAAGLPRMRGCRFVGRFPFAHVELEDPSLPVRAKVEGWSPFIPGNADDSSLPIAAFNVTLHNPGRKTVHAAVALSAQNCAGAYNEYVSEANLSALHLHAGKDSDNAMFIASPKQANSWQLNWTGSMLFMYLQHFVDTFGATGKLDQSLASPGNPVEAKETASKVGSLAFEMSLGPGEMKTIPLLIGWYFPIFDTAQPGEMTPQQKPWRNWYGARFKSALDVARYATANLTRLESESRLFQTTFFSSILPGVVLESASTQLAILKSPTIIRYPDGTVYGWEGCATNHRLGFGTCNHVWNYQQAIPYLFPDLQRSILNNFYNNGFRESDGAIQFRLPAGPSAKAADMPSVYQAPFGMSGKEEKTNFFTAADGQFGMICQVYRDWQISGDTAWLQTMWPRVKKSLEYAWTVWDTKRNGLLEGSHHNTLDLNFTTPETMCGSEYQAALLAGEQLALEMNDTEAAAQFRRVFESGKSLTDKELFNGEFYQQKTPAPGLYQLGSGCISDQLTGQLYAQMLDLEDIYDRQNIQTALKSLFRYNFRSSMDDLINTDRPFSLNDDAGLMIATWPRGGRPAEPLLYCYETMPGFEYQVAFNLIYAGLLNEGLTLIQSIRDRFDGKKRNPFCEFEWGNHYGRSLIAYTGMIALARFRYSGVDRSLQFAPQIQPENARQFFSVGAAWGTISQNIRGNRQTLTVTVEKGRLEVTQFLLKTSGPVKTASAVAGSKITSGSLSRNQDSRRSSAALARIVLSDTLTAAPGIDVRLELELTSDPRTHGTE